MKNISIKSIFFSIFLITLIGCNNNEEILKENEDLKNQIKTLEDNNAQAELQTTIDSTVIETPSITEEKPKQESVVSKPKTSNNSKPKKTNIEPKKEVKKEEVKDPIKIQEEKVQNKFGESQKSQEQLKKDLQEQEQKVKSKFGN
jgi:hypothetical protein